MPKPTRAKDDPAAQERGTGGVSGAAACKPAKKAASGVAKT
jgi:hypothetical protein